MGRAPCCDKTKVKKGPWSPDEDRQLKEYIEKHGTGGNWIALPQKAGLKRCGKSCRLRWLNYLRPNIKHGDFSEDEDRTICNLFATIGSRWSIIAAQLPGRTDNDIKNYWNTKLKKKLMGFPPSQRQAHHQQQRRQRLLFPSTPLESTAPLIPSGLIGLEGLPVVSPYLLDPTSTTTGPMNHCQVKESGSLLFGSHEQSCTTSSDGSCTRISYGKDMDYELYNGGMDSFLFGGMEETQKMLLGVEPSSECNYDIKPMVGTNNGCNSFYLDYPSSATMDISFKTPQERVMYYY